MSSYNELVGILKELLFNRFYPKPEYIRGLLGDGRGNVVVPGRPDYNYARFNRSATETFEVFNKEVSQPVDGTPVLMGEYPWQQGLFQVVGIDWATYIQTGWGDSYASLQAHHETHEWPNFTPGSDVMNVYMRAITPLRAQAAGSGSTSVIVNAYEYDSATGTNYNWPGLPPISLGPATPPTGSMRYMGVYLNPTTNTLGVVSGSTTIYTDALEPDRPAWPRGVMPSAYVRLYGGQAAITERDIRDARRLWESTLIYTGSMGPHNLLSQFHSDTLPASVVAGDLVYGNSTPKWARLPIVTGSYLGSFAGTPAWGVVSQLGAPDGNPNPALWVDNAGDVATVGDVAAGGTAKGIVQGVWFDYGLVDSGNASGVATHFRDNGSGTPAGWTAADAAVTSLTNYKYSFWYLANTSADGSWDYRKQTSINLESQAASAVTTFMVGPIILTDGRYTADISYHFGIYRNNAGAIDTGTYSRVRVWWDSATSLWKLVAEERDGSVAHSATITLDQTPLQPLYVAFTVQNAVAKSTRQFWGSFPDPSVMRKNIQNPTTAPTWGQMWVRFHQTRGAGINDALMVGALDYVGNVA